MPWTNIHTSGKFVVLWTETFYWNSVFACFFTNWHIWFRKDIFAHRFRSEHISMQVKHFRFWTNFFWKHFSSVSWYFLTTDVPFFQRIVAFFFFSKQYNIHAIFFVSWWIHQLRENASSLFSRFHLWFPTYRHCCIDH